MNNIIGVYLYPRTVIGKKTIRKQRTSAGERALQAGLSALETAVGGGEEE
jgi:hypothetical protein